MAEGLDELMEYLLSEIATCGTTGASISQLTDFVKSFYKVARPADHGNNPVTSSSKIATSTPDTTGLIQTVDDAFIASVWKWLGRQPDVSIGKNGVYNNTPLQQFQPQGDADSQNHRNRFPRIYVSEELVYRSICGHSPDRSRVFPAEYALLVQIAAARDEGILQGVLGRRTGQDKRSVPKRTDSLQAKGYIVKQPVYVKGTKTSLLILRRYARRFDDTALNSPILHDPASLASSSSRELHVRHVIQRLSDRLSDGSLVELETLLNCLDDESDVGKKILLKIIRPLEKAGCFKRARAALGPAAHLGDLKIYVQQIRIPSEADLSSFQNSSIPLDRSIEEWLREEKAKSTLHVPDDSGELQSPHGLVQWNPERLTANQLQQAVSEKSSVGLTDFLARSAITGSFTRRTLQPALLRLSHCGLLSQPKALRHLTIVRTDSSVGRIFDPLHHSLTSSLDGVESGLIDVTNVPGARKSLRSSVPLQLEDSGERPGSTAYQLLSRLADGDFDESQTALATPGTVVQLANASDSLPASGEPEIVIGRGGIENIGRIIRGQPTEKVEQSGVRSVRSVRRVRPHRKTTTKRKIFHSDSEERPRGRPRKFVRGTEKFWQYHFWQAKLAVTGEENAPATKEGVMNDPAGRELFESRPEDFDETLVEAKANGLPLPATPDGITDGWVRQTQAVLERFDKGAYITPVGMYLGRVKYRSQLLIVRSNRLNSVDWYDRTIVPQFRFISSSAAHSFQCQRYYPQTANLSRPPRRAPKKMKFLDQAKKEQTELVQNVASGSAPQLGVFVEPVLPKKDPVLSTKHISQGPLPQNLSNYNQYMDTTESDSDKPEARRSSKTNSRSRLMDRTSPVATGDGTRLSERPSLILPSRPSTAVVDEKLQPPSHRAGSSTSMEDFMRRLTAEAHEGMQTGKPVQTFDLKRMPNTSSVATELPPVEEATICCESRDDLPARVQERTHGLSVETLEAPSRTHDAVTLITNFTPRNSSAGARSSRLVFPVDSQGPREEFTRRLASFSFISQDGPYDETVADFSRPAEDLQTHSGEILQKTDGLQEKERESIESRPQGEIDILVNESPRVSSRIRKRSVESPDLEALETQSSAKHRSQATGGTGHLCQRVILELVTLAQGAAPNNRTTLQRCMISRWQANGGKDRPLMKPIKVAVRNLIASEKLKEHIFTFRGKGGVTLKRSILHLPIIDASSIQINELKKTIIDADATEYMPQQWLAETLAPLKVTSKRRRIALTEDSQSPRPLHTSEESPQPDEAYQVDNDNSIVSTYPRTRARLTPNRGKIAEDLSTSDRMSTTSPNLASLRTAEFLPLRPRSVSAEPSQSPATGFLTLKVPRLGTLHQVRAFNSTLQEFAWQASLPVVPPTFTADASSPSTTAPPTPGGQRTSRPKRQRHKPTRYNDSPREIIWAPPKQVMPDDLEHLLRLEVIDSKIPDDHKSGDLKAPLLRDIEIVASWEERDAAFIQSRDVRWTFINHKSSRNVHGKIELRAWYLINFDDDNHELQHELVEFPSHEPFIAVQRGRRTRTKSKATQRTTLQSSVDSPLLTRRLTRQAAGMVKKRQWTDDFEAAQWPKRARKAEKSTAAESVSVSDQEDEGRTSVFPNQSSTKKLQSHSEKPRPVLESEDLQVAIAVICICTLTGGIEKIVDWQTVLELFPEQDEAALRRRWKTISQRYSVEIHNLSNKFQDMYVDAIEQGTVPAVNFDDLAGTDWRGIVSWTRSQIAAAKLQEDKGLLVSSRAELLENDDIQLQEIVLPKEMFGYGVPLSHLAREESYSSVIGGATTFGFPAQDSVQKVDNCGLELQDSSFAAIRSCVLTVMQTADNSFDPQAAEEKLIAVVESAEEREAIIGKVLQALRRDKLIVKPQIDQMEHGDLRQWQLSSSFEESLVLRRLVHHSMLKSAASYKMSTLDPAFSRGENITIAKGASIDDGVMLAILSLTSQGRLRIRHGPDVPNSRYGVDWEKVGYQTKLIDKSKVAFSMVLQCTGAYLFGDPVTVARGLLVPRGGIDQPQGQVPLWVDIHGGLHDELWETVLAAVVGLVNVRPGIDAAQLAQMVNWTLTPWEVDLILRWSENCGLVTQTASRQGWDASEWWWMALGVDMVWS